jgi:hypothetical protein
MGELMFKVSLRSTIVKKYKYQKNRYTLLFKGEIIDEKKRK